MNKKNKLLLVTNPLVFVIYIILNASMVTKAEAVEFNKDVLDADDKSNIDLKQFSQVGYIMPGKYFLTPTVNGERISEETPINFYQKEAQTLPEACLTPQLAANIGLKEKYFRRTERWHNGECTDFGTLEGIKTSADISAEKLNISVPQLYMEYTELNWVPPSRWDEGVPGIIVDYNASSTITKTKPNDGSQNQSTWVNGSLGMNRAA